MRGKGRVLTEGLLHLVFVEHSGAVFDAFILEDSIEAIADAEDSETEEGVEEEDESSANVGDEEPAEHGSHALSHSVVGDHENGLCCRFDVCRRDERDVRRSRGPHCREHESCRESLLNQAFLTLEDLEGQHHPGVVEPAEDEEAKHVREQADVHDLEGSQERRRTDLDMTELVDHLEGVEEGRNLGGMIHDGRDSKENRRSSQILEMPVEEGEDEARAEADDHDRNEIEGDMRRGEGSDCLPPEIRLGTCLCLSLSVLLKDFQTVSCRARAFSATAGATSSVRVSITRPHTSSGRADCSPNLNCVAATFGHRHLASNVRETRHGA